VTLTPLFFKISLMGCRFASLLPLKGRLSRPFVDAGSSQFGRFSYAAGRGTDLVVREGRFLFIEQYNKKGAELVGFFFFLTRR